MMLPTSAPQIQSQNHPLSNTADQTSTILLIDDDPDALNELNDCFALDGIQCLTAESGDEAMSIIANAPQVDLVVSDINLGTHSGLDILAQFRQQGRDTRFILMTGGGRRSDAIEALRLGVCDFIEKPIDYPKLLSAVRRAIASLLEQRTTADAQVELKRQNGALTERNELIRGLLGRYVDDGIVRKLLETPDSLRFDGALTRATILVSDLRGFTELSERLEAEKVVQVLNNYYRLMIHVVRKYGGTVDNLVGDALMAVFGVPEASPDDSVRAIACALEMQQYISKVNELNNDAGLPSVEIGIGLNTGEVVAGNIGSERHAKFSVIGSPVNRAWRIESLTLGGQILASKETIEDSGTEIHTTGSLRVKLRGVGDPVEICEVLAVDPNH